MSKIMLPVFVAAVAAIGASSVADFRSASAFGMPDRLYQKSDTVKEVPAHCARIVNPAARRKCLQNVRK